MVLTPHHLVHHAGVALDEFHHLGRYDFVGVGRYGQAVVAVLAHLYRHVYRLQQVVGVDAGQDEGTLVQRFRTLGRGTDADSWEAVAHAGEERAFFGQRTAIRYHGKGIHLQAVVVVETEGFLTHHARIELEAALLQAVAAARMATVQNRHVVFLGHGVDGGKQAVEVFLCIDVLFAVGREQDVLAFFQAQTLVHVAGFDLGQVLVQHLGHRTAAHVGALRSHAAGVQVTAGVLAVADVYIADDVHDAAVGLFGQTLVEAAVTGLHVEDGDVQTLGTDDRQAGVGITQHQHGIRLSLHHQLVALVDDVAHRSAQVIPHGIQIHFGVGQLQVLEEDSVQVVVVVLARVCQYHVKIFSTFIDYGRQADNLRTRAHDNQ